MNKFENIFQKHQLPKPPGKVEDMRWIAGTHDWWCLIEKNWYWLDGRYKKEWKLSSHGP